MICMSKCNKEMLQNYDDFVDHVGPCKYTWIVHLYRMYFITFFWINIDVNTILTKESNSGSSNTNISVTTPKPTTIKTAPTKPRSSTKKLTIDKGRANKGNQYQNGEQNLHSSYKYKLHKKDAITKDVLTHHVQCTLHFVFLKKIQRLIILLYCSKDTG